MSTTQAVVAGGVNELFEDVYRRLSQMGALSPMRSRAPEGCRPFAPDHNDPVLGEGATFLVLEGARGRADPVARIVAEIAEAAWGNVPTAPHTGRARRADVDSPVARLLRAPAVPRASSAVTERATAIPRCCEGKIIGESPAGPRRRNP